VGLSRNVKNVQVSHPGNASPRTINGVRKRHHSAHMTLTIGYTRGFLLSLSDRSILLSVHPEASAGEPPTNHHTLGIRRCMKGSHPWVSSVLSLTDMQAAHRSRRDGDTESELTMAVVGVSQEQELHTRENDC